MLLSKYTLKKFKSNPLSRLLYDWCSLLPIWLPALTLHHSILSNNVVPLGLKETEAIINFEIGGVENSLVD